MTTHTGHDNKVDRIIFKWYDPAVQGAVIVFKERDCRGDAGRFDADPDPRRPARYTRSMLEDLGSGGSEISSIMIPYGYSVTLYDDDALDGDRKTTLEGPKWNSNDHFKLQCLGMPDGWDNKVSSLIVYRTNQGGKAKGRWLSATSTESFTFTYNVGFKSTVAAEEQETEKWSLSYQMTTGIEFEGITDSETMSESYSGQVMTDTKTSMTKDVSVNWELKCTGSEGASGGVGLWQFAVYTADENSYTLTSHTVCRYGSLYNHPPKCPWNACIGGDCSDCERGWY